MNIPLNDNYIAVLSAHRGERGIYEILCKLCFKQKER